MANAAAGEGLASRDTRGQEAFLGACRTRCRLAVAAAWLVVAAALAGARTAGASVADEDCLKCHADSTVTAPEGGAIPVGALAESVHGRLGLACVACHESLDRPEAYPHPEQRTRVACGGCHPGPAEALAESVHGGSEPVATCVDCHGNHDIRPAADHGSRVYTLALPRTCGRCHGLGKELGGNGRAPAVAAAYRDSIHGRAVVKAGLVVAPSCGSCHGAHDVRHKSDPRSRVFRNNVPATCGACHEGIRPKYDAGVHGTAVAQGNEKAPVCNDCHTAHRIGKVDVEGWRLAVTEECGTCHDQSLHTYRDTYHGQVTALGFARIATCSDCHDAHDIFPSGDPRSAVSADNRVTTCRRCHEGVNGSFAQYDPHADPRNRDRNPVLYYANLFMRGLLGVVFVFFALHNGLWLARSLRERKLEARKKGGPPE